MVVKLPLFIRVVLVVGITLPHWPICVTESTEKQQISMDVRNRYGKSSAHVKRKRIQRCVFLLSFTSWFPSTQVNTRHGNCLWKSTFLRQWNWLHGEREREREREKLSAGNKNRRYKKKEKRSTSFSSARETHAHVNTRLSPILGA